VVWLVSFREGRAGPQLQPAIESLGEIGWPEHRERLRAILGRNVYPAAGERFTFRKTWLWQGQCRPY
jgi:hypothetical protein